MSKLLYIKASPRERSRSAKVANAFLESYQNAHPEDTVQMIDVFEKDLPAFDGFALQAKYSIMHGKGHSSEEAKSWSKVEDVIAEFKDADKYLISLPMWNFGIPYRLKHYLDILIQPGYTFTADGNGYQGLIKAKPLTVIYSRGGAYAPGTGAESYDLQKQYLELALGFIGFEDIRSIFVEPTMHGSPEEIEKMMAQASQKAAQTAREF